jgi:hypothetical protein
MVIPMIELFSKGDTSATFADHYGSLVKEIDSFSDEKILGADIDEWTTYFFDKYKIQPLTLFLDKKKPTLSETKIEKVNPRHERVPHEQKVFYIDGYKVI